jgi:hypothetical protein
VSRCRFVVVTVKIVLAFGLTGIMASGCGGGGGRRNCVEGTVRDEKNMPVVCRLVICKHDSGQLCDHTVEGAPCKLEQTKLGVDVVNGVFRIDDVPPIDRKELAYAAVVLTGTNKVPETFFVFPDTPIPPHRAFSLPFANKGAVVNLVLKPVPPPKKDGKGAETPPPEGMPSERPKPSSER